jgi:Ubiquitin-activating enzyme active site
LADAVRDSMHEYNKSINIETINCFLFAGDSQFEDLWSRCDILVTTLSNSRLLSQLIEKAKATRKKLLIIDCPELEVQVYPFLSDDNFDNVKNSYNSVVQTRMNENKFTFDMSVVKYPYVSTHCIHWAQALFEQLFVATYKNMHYFHTTPQKFIESFEKTNDLANFSSFQTLSMIRTLYADDYPFNFVGCVRMSIQIMKVIINLC